MDSSGHSLSKGQSLRSILSCAVGFLGMLLCSCQESQTELTKDQGNNSTITRTAQKDQVHLSVELDRSDAVVGDPIVLTIEVTAPDGYNVEMPSWDDSIDSFNIDEHFTPPDVPEGNQRRWSHQYTISTFESGEVEFPAVEISFTPAADESSGNTQTVEACATQPILLTIHSFVGGDAGREAHRDIRGMVEVPLPRSLIWIWWLIGGVCLVIVTTAIVVLRRHRALLTPALEPELPPHVWALQELDRLHADDLFRHNKVQEFYFRLSDIVRNYIERRFGLMAPERTTEEFLREAHHHTVLSETHQQLLSDFLTAADMVKFALYRPVAEEGNTAGQAARNFVEETTPTPSTAQPTDAPQLQEVSS